MARESSTDERATPPVALAYSPALESYRFAPAHPFTPARHVLAVRLMSAWGLLDGVARIDPGTANLDDLAAVHDSRYVQAVMRASAHPELAESSFGIGPGDTPAFAGMHEAALLVAGATVSALDAVLSGRATRAFGPAGGLHHAHRDRAAGFCVYNDCALAIGRATRARPGLRVAYVDIDVHHGDGVEEAFYDRADVLTLSVHESGAYLYPGSGHVHEMGAGPGHGYALNVPLAPGSGAASYHLVLEQVIGPALRSFSPDVIVLQGGADSHRDDPLAGLDNTVAGYLGLVSGIVDLADELCGGRIAMVGGGGYESYSAVPRMWAGAMAVLMGAPVPQSVPATWRTLSHQAAAAAGSTAPPCPERTLAEGSPPPPAHVQRAALEATVSVIEKLTRAHPLLCGELHDDVEADECADAR